VNPTSPGTDAQLTIERVLAVEHVRLARIRVASAYAGHSDSALGVTRRYTKLSPDGLRNAHALLFFDDVRHVFRWVRPTATGSVEFAV
jgi:hypothetical protein